MKIGCPDCNTVYPLFGHSRSRLPKTAVRCPGYGRPVESSPCSPTSSTPADRTAGAITSCAILSSGNRLELFDIPCTARSKTAG